MMNPKLIKNITAALAALRPFVFAVVGGLTVATMQKCQKEPPIQLVVKLDK